MDKLTAQQILLTIPDEEFERVLDYNPTRQEKIDIKKLLEVAEENGKDQG